MNDITVCSLTPQTMSPDVCNCCWCWASRTRTHQADSKYILRTSLKHLAGVIHTSAVPRSLFSPRSPSSGLVRLSSWGCSIKNGWLLSATGIYLCETCGEKAWQASISCKHSQLTGLIPSAPPLPLAALQTSPRNLFSCTIYEICIFHDHIKWLSWLFLCNITFVYTLSLQGSTGRSVWCRLVWCEAAKFRLVQWGMDEWGGNAVIIEGKLLNWMSLLTK